MFRGNPKGAEAKRHAAEYIVGRDFSAILKTLGKFERVTRKVYDQNNSKKWPYPISHQDGHL